MPIHIYMLIATFGAVLLAVKVVFSNKAFIQKNDLLFKVVILFTFLFLIGFHFYETQLWMGLVATGLAFLAFVKYLFDQKRDKEAREKENG